MVARKYSIEELKCLEAFEILIKHFGGNIESEGMCETPARAFAMFSELLEGTLYTNTQIAEMHGKSFKYTEEKNLVVVQDIPIFSLCEHHLALMYNMKVHVAYVPNGRVIGLSKIARIAQLVGKRFQLQERIGTDIREILQIALDTEDVMVIVEGEHSCMTARGARVGGAKTKTSAISGKFWDTIPLREEALALIRG